MSTATQEQAGHAIASQARALLRRVVAAAKEQDRNDLVEELAAAGRRLENDTLSVVVSGEGNRGKSSLINALVDRPALLPVSAERSTARHVAVRRCEPGGAEEAWAHLGGDDRREVALEDLERWVDGAEHELADPRVRHVDVTIQHELLDGNLVLIDTPGVGGLDSAHGEAALAALALADAVLFVVDASVPISAVELAFLKQAAERVDALLVVLNRIDLTPAWRTILAEDAALLSSAFGPGCEPPILPLSARMKIRGDRLAGSGGEQAAFAEELRADSGCTILQRQLSAWSTGAASAVRTANLCRVGSGMVARMTATELAVLASFQAGTGELGGRARERRRHHTDLGTAARRRRTELQDRMSVLTREVDTRIATAAGEVRRDYSQRVSEKRFKDFEAQLSASLAATATHTVEWLSARLAETEAESHAAFEGFGLRASDMTSQVGLAAPAVRPSQAPKGKINVEELLSRAPYVVAMLAVGNPYMAAAAFAGLVVHRHLLGGRARQEQFRSQLSETITDFTNDLKLLLHEAVVNARSTLVTELDEAVQERLTDLVEEIRALDALATRDAGERETRRKLAAERVRSFEELVGRLEDLRRSATGALRGAIGPSFASVTS